MPLPPSAALHCAKDNTAVRERIKRLLGKKKKKEEAHCLSVLQQCCSHGIPAAAQSLGDGFVLQSGFQLGCAGGFGAISGAVTSYPTAPAALLPPGPLPIPTRPGAAHQAALTETLSLPRKKVPGTCALQTGVMGPVSEGWGDSHPAWRSPAQEECACSQDG